MRIMSIVGARPNFMKIAPIAHAIEKYRTQNTGQNIEHIIIHTGQHYDERMSHSFFKQLSIPEPDINLEVGSASHGIQTGQIMQKFEPVLLAKRPEVLILVGDVNSTVACALVASKAVYNNGGPLKRPVIAHVEAGLRSFDRDMPEEINRVLTDALSDILFTTEESALTNLEKEGIPPGKIHFVGNVMIDTLIHFEEQARKLDVLKKIMSENIQCRQIGYSDSSSPASGEFPYGLVTLHRPGNVDHPDSLKPLLDCIAEIAQRVPLIFPLHPRTRNSIERFHFQAFYNAKNLIITDPLDYLGFLALLRRARLVLTDSGGIQEETTYLGVPCITLRENTERPITLSAGTNYLVGNDIPKIIRTAFAVLDGRCKKGGIPPLWDGKASERIVNILLDKSREF